MGRKITQYPNNVSVTPDELSLLDVSEKTGLATYESRKWTLSAFKAWLNANITIPVVNGTQGQIPLFVQDDEIGSNTRFTFIDNEGTEVGFRFSDTAGNLTQAGVSLLNIETQGLTSNSTARLANWSDTTNKGILSFRKSRGNKFTPTQVLSDDILGHIIFIGQHNSGGGTTTGIIEVSAIENYDININNLGTYERSALTAYKLYLAPTISTSGTPNDFPNNLVLTIDGDGRVYFKNYKFPIADGTANQVLKTNGAGELSWSTPTVGIDGSGNTNYIGVWADADTMSFINGASISETGSGINAYPTLTLASGAGVGSTYQELYLGSYNSTTNSDSRSSQVNLTTKTTGVDWSHINLTYYSTTNTNPITGNALGDINFISGSNNSSNVHGAKILAIATQNHNNTSRGTALVFTVAKDNTIVQFEALKLDSDGRVKISSAYKLPLTDGTNGQVLVTDGAGSVSWAEKSDKNITLDRKTASYIAVASDNGKLIEMNVATANTFTINASLFSAGNQILVSQYGAGQTTITAGAGVTLRSSGGKLKTSAQYSLVTIIAISSTEFYVAGDLTA